MRHAASLVLGREERILSPGRRSGRVEAEGSHHAVGSTGVVVASGFDIVGTCGYCQTVRARSASHEGIHKEPVLDASSLARTVLKPGGYGVGPQDF
jgi:hypothetical protein